MAETEYNQQYSIISEIIATIKSCLEFGITLEQNGSSNHSDSGEGENESESSDGPDENPKEPELSSPKQQQWDRQPSRQREERKSEVQEEYQDATKPILQELMGEDQLDMESMYIDEQIDGLEWAESEIFENMSSRDLFDRIS